jgi:hypothetical protein
MLKVLRYAVGSSLSGLRPARKKIEQRRLLVVISLEDGDFHILTAPDKSLVLASKERTREKLFRVLRKPWPLFCDMNVVSLGRASSFIHDHIEYDVVKVKPCHFSSAPAGLPIEALTAHGFGTVSLECHPLKKYIRKVLQK